MDTRKITLIIASIITFVLLSVGFSFTVTKNSYNPIEKQNQIVETTTYSLKIGPQLHQSEDEQK